MFVKPKPGIKVRDPISTEHLPESGKEVPASSYWIRRLRSGDVLEVNQIPDSKSATKKREE